MCKTAYDEAMQQKFITALNSYPSIANLLNYTDFSTPPTFDHFYDFIYNQKNGHLVNLSLNLDRMKDQYTVEYLLQRAAQKQPLNHKLKISSESEAKGALCYFINYFLWKKMEFIVTLFTFTARQVVIIFIISMLVTIFASFVPVYHAASKKPIEAIRTA